MSNSPQFGSPEYLEQLLQQEIASRQLIQKLHEVIPIISETLALPLSPADVPDAIAGVIISKSIESGIKEVFGLTDELEAQIISELGDQISSLEHELAEYKDQTSSIESARQTALESGTSEESLVALDDFAQLKADQQYIESVDQRLASDHDKLTQTSSDDPGDPTAGVYGQAFQDAAEESGAIDRWFESQLDKDNINSLPDGVTDFASLESETLKAIQEGDLDRLEELQAATDELRTKTQDAVEVVKDLDQQHPPADAPDGYQDSRPSPSYYNDENLRAFLSDPDYNQQLASNDGGGIAGDYEKYLQEQVADWDDDGDGVLSAEERAFRDDLNATADQNSRDADSQSDVDAATHESERGEGEYDPDSIVGFDDDGNPVTAAEAALNSGDSGAAVGNSLVGDGGIDINVGAEQNAALQSGAQNATDLYHAIEGGDEISMLLEGGSLLLDIDRYMDTNGGGFIGDASESGIGNALDVGQSAYGFYNALENGSTVSQIGSGMNLAQNLTLFISWNAPRNEPKKRTLSRRATRSLRFSAKTGAAELASLRQSSRLSVLACDAWRREPEISNSNLLR